jgi:adenosylmethionine-8-amino-7-oxononanoate aminotransferase
MSGRLHYKKLYGPMLSEVVTTASPYPYRSGLADYAREGAAHYARLFEEAVLAAGPETIAGFIAEPIIGSSAGAAVPPPGYFEAIGAICKKYGILMIADEILCGTGRSGDFFACKPTGFTPDLLVLGKGLGGGVVALSALMVRQDHLEEMRQGSGYFQHAQTYLQAPMMTAAGLAVLDYLRDHDLLAHVRQMGSYLQAALQERIAAHPHVGSVQGLGLLAGVELVADRASRAPFARARKMVEQLVASAFASGLILWPNVGQANGSDGDLVMIGPPLVITRLEIDELIDTLDTSLRETFAQVKP